MTTAEGQFNVITNKFEVGGLEPLLPPFRGYEIGGGLKILANLDGNFNRPQEAELMLNVSLENGRLKGNGLAIEEAALAMDYGRVSLQVKQARLKINDSSLEAKMTIYNPFQEPVTTLEISSERLVPDGVFKAVHLIAGDAFGLPAVPGLEIVEAVTKEMIPAQESLQDFKAELKYREGKWDFSSLQFVVYEGAVDASGTVDLTLTPPTYSIAAEVNHLSLARFFGRGGKTEKILDGNLFLKTQMSGLVLDASEWASYTAGTGSIAVTNGEFQTFDILEQVGKIEGFSNVNLHVFGSTPF
ncbi:MAG: AsmA family protein, partial [candidate division Zixibacteria bacterium]|nr:AsmA family protein [candidate division Zixibacteria bacterium]